MISDLLLQRLSGVLCIASAVLCPLLIFRVIDFSMIFAAPLQVGIIFVGGVLIWGRFSSSCKWDGSVPPVLRVVLPMACGLGVLLMAYGFGMMSTTSPSGETAHHLNAYLEQGRCLAVFNEAPAVEMPQRFCDDFNVHFAAAFCGIWLFLAAFLHWMSWMRRDSKHASTRRRNQI
jgi:hypothetical protein